MIAFWKLGKVWLISIISLIALFSLGLTEWGWREFPDANFYLIPTRAWELMIGALLAFYLYYKTQSSGMICHIASLLGFGLIIYSIIYFDENIPFPSLYSLLPTIGTALIILFTAPNTLVYHILSTRIMVGIGVISYSAYLWHYPLFVFAKTYSLDELSIWMVCLLSISSLLLAYFSWRFIERPFRNRQGFTRKQIFTSSIITSLLLIIIGLALTLSDGATFRFY